MAFGQHWEWRGFGKVSNDLQDRIESLDLRFASNHPTIDTYLWTPDGPANVKLRHGDLKFKRLLETDGDLQHWLEDEDEIHPFPLDAEVVASLEQALTITLPENQCIPVGRSELVELLRIAVPPVHILVVEKIRRFFSLPTGFEEPIIVEFTDLIRPEPISSIALEHAESEAVLAALVHLGLTDSAIRSLDYLQALSIWSDGETLNPPVQTHA